MTLRPELNGTRVKVPNEQEIYLIDQGQKRWIPNPATYDNLFRDWNGIYQGIDVLDIDRGPDITIDAVLAQGKMEPQVYPIDNSVKRWVTSPSVMDKYYFRWPTQPVDHVLVDFIPQGLAIT